MDLLRAEVAARPMRCFAVGVLAVLAAALALVALCVTMIGIPVALIGGLVAIFGIYAGISATLATLGQGTHRAQDARTNTRTSRWARHLLASVRHPPAGACVIIAGFIGFGALVASRLAGFVPSGSPPRRAGFLEMALSHPT